LIRIENSRGLRRFKHLRECLERVGMAFANAKQVMEQMLRPKSIK